MDKLLLIDSKLFARLCSANALHIVSNLIFIRTLSSFAEDKQSLGKLGNFP